MPDSGTVYVIDDDAAVRDSLALLLEAEAFAVQCFASGLEFLEVASSLPPGCVITDIRMPGIDGFELLERLRDIDLTHPVIVMTAQGEVALAVRALQCGAVDFIEKPFSGPGLFDTIQSALRSIGRAGHGEAESAEIVARIASLAPQELAVMEHLIAGKRNDEIASLLDVGAREVEVHRARVMEKMRASNLSALVRMAATGGKIPPRTSERRPT